MTTHTPVAFFIYNRPALTAQVFAQIREARPRTLLVVGDGAQSEAPGDSERVQQTRAIVDAIDWPCERLLEFAPANLGCRRRISTGLDWVFSQVPEAIILEDDCLPHSTFFPYCDQLIERYRNEERVFAVSGNCFLSEKYAPLSSYYFSKYVHCWGWATWRRAWARYDVMLRQWPEYRDSGGLRRSVHSRTEHRFWKGAFNEVYDGRINTWDYQLSFAAFQQSGLTVLPRTNLVSNIGFGNAATHTFNGGHSLARLPTYPMAFPLRHPGRIEPFRWADKLTFHQIYRGRKPGFIPSLSATLHKWTRSLLRRVNRGFLQRPSPLLTPPPSRDDGGGNSGERAAMDAPHSATRRPLRATNVGLS